MSHETRTEVSVPLLFGSRPAAYKPQLEFVTAYINPSTEAWGEGEQLREKADFSYVITNSNTD